MSFFPPRATLMSILQELHLAYSSPLWLLHTYEKIIFLRSLLLVASILIFLNFYSPLLAILADHLPCAC